MISSIVTALFIIIAIALIVGIVFGICALIRQIKRMKKSGESHFIIYFYLMIACLIISAASWVFNFGLIRIILAFFLLPLSHMVAFAVLMYKTVVFMKSYKRFRVYWIISYITYLTSHLLFPDIDERGPGYVFFGLIRNDAAYSIAMPISLTCFAVNVIILAIMATDLIRCVCSKHDDCDDQFDVDMIQNK